MQFQKLLSTYLNEKGGWYTETPEEMWFLQALAAFVPTLEREPWEYIERVQTHFKYLSEYLIVPATPQLLNLRKENPNLSSCFILDVEDSTDSICSVQTKIAQISRNAGGVGLYLGRLRPSGSWIKGSPGKANKITDWVKIYESTTNAFNQQGKRKGALTVALPVWHKDILDFLEVIDLDIGEIPRKSPDVFTQVVIPPYFWKYLRNNQPWYLIDLHEVTHVLGRPGLNLVELQGEEAEEAYGTIVGLIRDGKLKNYRQIDPREILRKIFYYWNRKGLPYVVFEDNLNRSGYEEKIYSANLCVESFSPFRIADGKIHTCNITNVNLYKLYKKGILFDEAKLKEFVFHLYEYMANLLEIQNIPVEESLNHNWYYRTVTAGFLGLADLMVAYSLDTGQPIVYRTTARKVDKQEVFSFLNKVFGRFLGYAYQASAKLAAKRGPAPVWKEGKYNPDVEVALQHLPPEEATRTRALLKRYGHGVTLYTTCPPNTSTSIYAGVTAGVLPPFNLVQVEDQQKGLFVHFAPEVERGQWYYDVYSRHWTTIEDYKDLIDFIAHLQRYIGSGISFELVVNHNYFDNGKKLTTLYATVLSYAHKKGIKALYYWRHILKDKTVMGKEECESCAN
jgi:ribonucleoside-diphosphate reductase alpha chain